MKRFRCKRHIKSYRKERIEIENHTRNDMMTLFYYERTSNQQCEIVDEMKWKTMINVIKNWLKKKRKNVTINIKMSFVNCVDANEKCEKRRHFTDSDLNVFEFDDSNDETSFIDVSSRKKFRRKSLFSKTKKKKRNFIIRKQKKQIKKTRQLNEKIENHEHALLKKWLCDYSTCSNRNHHC